MPCANISGGCPPQAVFHPCRREPVRHRGVAAEALEDFISSEPARSRHEKAPRVTTGRFPEMERAKRLEREGQNSQPAAAPNTCENEVSPGALQGALDGKLPEKSATDSDSGSQVAAGDDADLRVVIAAWFDLNPKLKAAILAIVRAG